MCRGQELKYCFAPPATSISVGGTVADFGSVISEGTSSIGQRIGRVIEPVHFSLQGTLNGGQSGTITDDAYNVVRLIVAWIVPGTTLTGVVTVNAVVSPRIINGLIEVLYDKTFALGSPGVQSIGYMPATKEVRISLPLNSRKTLFYTGTAGNTVSTRTLVLYCVSDSGALPSPGFVSGQNTLFYIDN